MTDVDCKLGDDERRCLAELLDRIIPPCGERGLPGAGELGAGAAIEAEMQRNPLARATVEAGLREYSRLRAEGSAELLSELQEAAPGLIPTLVFHTYVAYYQDPRVTRQLGLHGRPPHPEGYRMEESDLSILEPVRRRGKLYRDAAANALKGSTS